MLSRRLTALAFAATATVVIAAGCSSSSDSSSTTTTPPTTVTASTDSTAADQAEILEILVTNDDGVASEGISALVAGLSALPNVKVAVVAPATQQSGQGGKVTGGELTGTPTKTLAGYTAIGVEGYPADAVIWALEQDGLNFVPDLVVSGINEGQNLGKLVDISGTVGAARSAVAHGIPSLAISSGTPGFDYETAVTTATNWVEEHRDGLLAGTYSGDPILLQSFNVPSCAPGTTNRGILEVPVADTDTDAYTEQDCASTLADPTNDIVAFNNGFITLSNLTPGPTFATTP